MMRTRAKMKNPPSPRTTAASPMSPTTILRVSPITVIRTMTRPPQATVLPSLKMTAERLMKAASAARTTVPLRRRTVILPSRRRLILPQLTAASLTAARMRASLPRPRPLTQAQAARPLQV